MGYSPSDVVAVAKYYVGYLEKRSDSQLDNFSANVGNNNYNIFAKYFDEQWTDFYNTKKQGQPYCDIFNDFCHVVASLKNGGTVDDAREVLCQPKKSAGAGCYYSAQYYRSAGRLDKTPRVGDQIFFLDSSNEEYHTGIVYAVDSTTVYTIEANTSGASGIVSNGGGVALKSYNRSAYASKMEFGHPKYTSTTASIEQETGLDYSTSKLTYYYPFRLYQNGSTSEPVYEDSDLAKKYGNLNAYEQAYCFGRYLNSNGIHVYAVLYKVDGYSDRWKLGYVKYNGGVS